MRASPKMRPTGLRDFGAFQPSRATSLHETAVVTKEEKLTPFPATVLEFVKHEVQHKDAPKQWLKFGGRLLLTCILLAFLTRSISWATLVSTLGNVQLTLVLVAAMVGAFGIVVSAYQWRYLLKSEHIQCDLARLIELYLVGMAFNHFLPTGLGGDTVKALYVGRASGNGTGSTSAVIMSRVTGFFGMLLLALPVLLIWHTQFRSDIIFWFILLSLLISSMIGGALCSTALLARATGYAWVSKVRGFSTILTKATQISEALKLAFKSPHILSGGIAWGMLFWLVSCLNYYMYAYALGITVPLNFYCVAIPFVSLVAFLPISINGFGVREGAFVYVCSMMHIAVTHALLLALLMDAQVLLFGATGGCIYLMRGYKRRVA